MAQFVPQTPDFRRLRAEQLLSKVCYRGVTERVVEVLEFDMKRE